MLGSHSGAATNQVGSSTTNASGSASGTPVPDLMFNATVNGPVNSRVRPGSVSPRPSRLPPRRQQQQQQQRQQQPHQQQQQQQHTAMGTTMFHRASIGAGAAVATAASASRSPSAARNSAATSGAEVPFRVPLDCSLSRATRPLRSVAVAGSYRLAAAPPAPTVAASGGGGGLDATDVASEMASSARFTNIADNDVTTIAASATGAYLAWGDAGGRLYVLERDPTLPMLRRGMTRVELDACTSAEGLWQERDRADGVQAGGGPLGSASLMRRAPSAAYSPVHGAVAYTAYTDPLSNERVRPNVTSVAFLPETGPSALLLSANENHAKLWRLVKVPSLPEPFRAVDLIGSRSVGPLCLPDQPTSVMKEAAKYNVDHERPIHSLCVVRDGEQFVTADAGTVRLWNVERTYRSLEVASIAGPAPSRGGDGEGSGAPAPISDEAINTVVGSIAAPNVLLVGTSTGAVRVADMRMSLRLQLGPNPGPCAAVVYGQPRACDGIYRCVVAATIGCDLSACGNYIAQRDVACMHLFDLRRAGGGPVSPGAGAPSYANGGYLDTSGAPSLVQRWVVEGHTAAAFGRLYPLGVLFERVPVRFVGRRLVTGGIGGSVLVASTIDSAAAYAPFGGPTPLDEIPAEVQVDALADPEGGGAGTTTDTADVCRLYEEARVPRTSCRRAVLPPPRGTVSAHSVDDVATLEEPEVSPSDGGEVSGSSSSPRSAAASPIQLDVGAWGLGAHANGRPVGPPRLVRCGTSERHNWYAAARCDGGVAASQATARRVTRLCVVPSSMAPASSYMGEVIAAVGDTAYHCLLPH